MKSGYKQTEVGVIPEEWDVATATEACELVVDCKNRTPPVVIESNYAVVRTPNVRNGQFVLEDLRFTDEESYRVWTARAIPQFGDIMITREAPLGEVCAVPADRKVCLGQRMMLYRPSPGRTSSTYLLYSLMSQPVRANLFRKIGGSTVGHAKVDDIRFLQLPLPSLPEQRAIAEALSDVDALLGGLDRLITKKRDLKQAAMQQLLTGQTRLPGFHDEWRTGKLSSFVLSHNSGVYKKSELYGQGSNIVGVSDLYGIDCVDGQGFAQVPLSAAERAKHTLDTNDLLYGVSSLVREGIARTVYVTERGAGTAFAWHTRRYSVNQSILLSSFLYYYLQARRARKYMIDVCIQTAITGINTVAYFACPVLIPSISEQTAIAEVLTDMDAELWSLDQRREKTRALKQAMMQELLTGKTRLI